MKITKRQLRKIIKEEKARLLNEQPDIPDVMGAMGDGKFQPRKEKHHPRVEIEEALFDLQEELQSMFSNAMDNGLDTHSIQDAIEGAFEYLKMIEK